MNFDEKNTITLQAASESGPKRAKRADAVANRELILATAERLFAEHSVANICMAAIAEAAGVGKGTLYRSFANKGELCLELMDEDMRRFQNRIIQLFRETYRQPAFDKLDAFLNQLVHFLDFHAPLLREAQQQGTLRNEDLADSSPYFWLSWLHETIGMLLQEAQENGEATDLDIPFLVDAILAPINAELYMYQRKVLAFEPQRISKGLRRLVLHGCKAE